MELVPESVVDTVKHNAAGKKDDSPESSPQGLSGDARTTVENSVADDAQQQAASPRPEWFFQRVDPIFYATLFVVSVPLVIGFYQFTAYSNRVVAVHLSEIESGKKLIIGKMALGKLDDGSPRLQNAQTLLTKLESTVQERIQSEPAGSLDSIPTSVSPVRSEDSQSVEVNELRQLLSEQSQLVELLSLENHELRLKIEFGDNITTHSTAVVAASSIEAEATDAVAATEVGRRAELSSPAPASASKLQQQSAIEVSDLVKRADNAFRDREYAIAGDLYGLAVQQNPRNRAANLGVASTALLSGGHELAIDRYRHLLSLYPDDQWVFDAMLHLATTDNMVETELRGHVLRLSTDQAVFYSMLGSYFGRQSRWEEANAAFFDALKNSVSPIAADILFNLAVSFEHLGSTSDAVEYYRQALDAVYGASFDRASAQSRLNVLTR